MQRGRGGDLFGFGDPFAGFGGLGRPGSLISSIFGGRDPFDDPFFTRPFGSMIGPSIFGANPFGSLPLPFAHLEHDGFLEDQPPPAKKSKGPIIREITSDGEEGDSEEDASGGADVDERGKGDSVNHSRPELQSYVQEVDEQMDVGRKRRQVYHVNNSSSSSHWQPRAHAYSFQSTRVTYGGPNGTYYTSSTTRKTGGDGVTFEECREADATTGKAAHRVSRGLHDKGHSVTRRLNSDGRVDTTQILHNLNQDDLPGFESVWEGNAKKHIPGWNTHMNALENGGAWMQSGSSSGRSEGPRLALPSSVQQQNHISNRKMGVPKIKPSIPSNRRA